MFRCPHSIVKTVRYLRLTWITFSKSHLDPNIKQIHASELRIFIKSQQAYHEYDATQVNVLRLQEL